MISLQVILIGAAISYGIALFMCLTLNCIKIFGRERKEA